MIPAHLAGSLLVVGFHGTSLPNTLEHSLRRGERAGVFVFRRNLSDLAALGALCAEVLETQPERPPLRAIDQEGGRVARLGAPCLRVPAARTLARGGAALLERTGAAMGRELAALGLSFDAAPVLDVDSNPHNPIIGDRAFARFPAQVIAAARAFARGLQRHVDGCGKHFPGHGDTLQDSHLELPTVARELASLRATELAPFAALAGELSSLMSAHVRYPALDAEHPATLSRRIATELLRGELGFQGPLLSDDLEMKALPGHPADHAVAAIVAGCDGLLVCSDEAAADACFEALVREIERSEAFAARAREAEVRLRTLRTRRNAPDAAALREAFAAHAPLQAELDALSAAEPTP